MDHTKDAAVHKPKGGMARGKETEQDSAQRASDATKAHPARTVKVADPDSERKIDRIGDRLVNIERLLQQSNTRSLPSPDSDLHGGSLTSVPTPTSGINHPASVDTINHAVSALHSDANEASTGVQSALASHIIEQAVGDSPAIYQNAELIAALQSLKDMVGKVEETPSSEFARSHWSIGGLADPPTELEIELLLQKASASLTISFTPGLTTTILREKFDTVFKGDKDAGFIRQVYVYGILCNLCTELSGSDPDPAFATRCKGLGRVFTTRLEQAVNELKLMMPATAEAASALTMAAGISVDSYKPYLAQSLSSHAASMVISLGYHNLSTMQSDTVAERESKIALFWMVYWLDNSFAVRLGRAPIIRDYEVTVPRLTSASTMPSTFLDAFNFSTRHSSLQCQATSSVPSDPHHAGLYVIMKESDAIMHYSTIALVQHATISTTSIVSPALESARKALEMNVDVWKMYKHLPDFIWSGHCHWTLLKTPITPFTVTFCHIIAHPYAATADIELLAEFVATLKELCRYSDGILKLHRLCDIFCKVASLYVQAKQKEASQKQNLQYRGSASMQPEPWMGQPAVNDIDQYLTAIGFAPPTALGDDGQIAMDGSMDFDASFLNDWYQGNNTIMGFLEQDIPDIPMSGQFDFGYTNGQ
ncbi:hypothetical protein LTR17_005962 [Elasticomyces elasticus]|nr:hypothetical protein LTR17_005962 [Elasticomyces elasticus]